MTRTLWAILLFILALVGVWWIVQAVLAALIALGRD